MKKIKGEWGYINYQRKRILIITLVLYVCSIGIYLFGYMTLHTSKSLFSVMAVLGILPASKSMVNLIMFLRYKSLDPNIYELYLKNVNNIPIIYELPFTTYEKTYFVEALVCCAGNVICYYGHKDKKNINIVNLKQHLNTVLKNDGHKDYILKIYDNRDEFLKRVKDINDHFDVKETARDEGILNTLRSVSL
ncbi:MAG: hypothetical protein K6E98_08230 [Lachnospiraceae bacterium]|nr:hypothetical protein [Lachnospiraceae bacterium]